MIVYFADRFMNILGQASTELPEGLTITDDLKTEDVETGVATFECRVPYDAKTRELVESCTAVGNYILRSNGGENEFYTIIESEGDTRDKDIYVYAEDAGLDLINEVVGAYEAAEAYPITHYIDTFAKDSGFEVGINEVEDLTRKLSWDGEATVTARLASVATQFDGCEISYSFDIDGLTITNKYINIHKERGKDIGVQLRLNKEVDRIITKKSVANLATALQCTGGTPGDADNPITLKGYEYDDGDFYVDEDGILKSREAVAKWSRYVWNKEPNKLDGYAGHIVKQFSYDTVEQKTLCAHAVTELKKLCEIEVNYEIDVARFPDDVKIGDRVNIIDDEGELYLSTRILLLETSVVNEKQTATLGEFLIKGSGIAQKVADLAAQFAENAASAARAKAIAEAAKTAADEAKTKADAAAADVQAAADAANAATEAANAATEAAAKATEAAENAESLVANVEADIQELEESITNAHNAAAEARQAAQTAETKASEAKQAALEAKEDAETAAQAVGTAQTTADEAIEKAAIAQTNAEAAIANATEAQNTAARAKADAEQAERDVATLGERLETVSDTMMADYARKTELTETTANLQSQISRNAAEINSAVSLLMTVDETANDAREKAETAQAQAAEAQTKADEATAAATEAQAAADTAAQAAIDAQAEADTAKAAAETAKSVADQAEANLLAAKIDLATVEARADATQEEIEAAQAAVDEAQTAATEAQNKAAAAVETATAAQERANEAATSAWEAQKAADQAKKDADIAAQLAEEAQNEAEDAETEADNAESLADQAKTTAEDAQATADAAQETANAATVEAENAKNTANAAAEEAQAAQTAADEAARKAENAAADLASAQTRLDEVLANVEATQEEVAAAQADVDAAQAAATLAASEAETAQAAADQAKADAEAAQTAAYNAKVAAEEAQAAADEAQDVANEAQAAVDGLAVRLTKAESNITQNARELKLSVAEVQEATDANGTRITTAESVIQQLANSISMLVTDGNGTSLMTQTENGWTFSTAELQAAVNDASNGLNDLTEQLGSTDAVVEGLQQAVADLGATAEYVRIGIYEDEPCIEMGESDSDFKLMITNTRIMFLEGENIHTYINNKGLVTENIEVQHELRQGGFVWAVRSNGNYGLMWKGVSE